MELILRPGVIEDAKECGRICYEAFKSIADQHRFPPEMPSIEIATALMTMRLSHLDFYSVVAELDGKIVGSIFLDERSVIAGGGPLSVDPPVMNGTIGSQLTQAMMDRATQQRFPGLRGVVIACKWRERSICMAVFIKTPTTSATLSKPFSINSSIARSNWLQSCWQVIVFSFRFVVDNWPRKDKLGLPFAKLYMNLQKEWYTNGAYLPSISY